MNSLDAGSPPTIDPLQDSSAEPTDHELLSLALAAGGIGTLDVDLHDLVARRGGVGAVAFGLRGQQSLAHDEWLALLHPDDRDAVTAAFDAMLRTGARYDVEYRIRRKTDGALRWVSVRAEPLRDGAGVPSRLIGVIQDVTDQKHAETALRESEARMRLAQRAVRLGSFEWRIGESHPAVTEEYASIHGLPAGTTTDSEADWLGRIHPEDRALVAEAVDSLRAGAPLDVEYRIIRPSDGTIRWVASRAETFLDDGGRGRRVIGAVRDVTERRETEIALRQLNEHLERRVSEEVAAREAAQRKLAQAQRMEALGQLAGGIAHDFNNVLQSIQGAATLIERRADDVERVRRLARMALEATARGASVTLRLLAFSRQSDLRAEPIDPGGLMRGLLEMLTHTLGAGIEVRLDLAPEPAWLLADRGQLETVIVNLATNARDAMEQGGVLTLATRGEVVSAEDERVVAGRLQPGDYVRLVVGDDGTGMDAATLARASEPFFTTKPLNKGTGLGLAMARGFAEQSGGLLAIESVLGQGTSVSILLPASPQSARAAIADDAPRIGRPAGRERRILVIDDEHGVRETLAPQLEAEGYLVTTLHDGASAVDHVAGGAGVDLLVCDLSMPGVNGIEVIRAVRRLLPGLPAILLTGFAGDEAAIGDLASDKEAGLFAVLRKPIAGPFLAGRIEAMLATTVEAEA